VSDGSQFKDSKSKILKLNEDEDDLLEDSITENKQAIEMAERYSNILSGMMDAFASIISNNLNEVMKKLTAISLVLMIPTLIASIFGMNVNFPFAGNSHFAFFGIILFSIFISTASVILFIYNRYL